MTHFPNEHNFEPLCGAAPVMRRGVPVHYIEQNKDKVDCPCCIWVLENPPPPEPDPDAEETLVVDPPLVETPVVATAQQAAEG